MKNAVLSVVVISHNQKEVLRRCLDSILSQKTNFPVQVIVSDDRSSDGTREMLLNDYKEKVIPTFFNSDEYETEYVFERAALNRINGLKLATGKYLIHTDGDDFFTSTDLFQTMVDKLEAHPECNLCCQNYCIVPQENIGLPHVPINTSKHFHLESILTPVDFMQEVGVLVNACFCMRRIDINKLEGLSSCSYDDVDITMRYMGRGSITLINRCDFVYVQYPLSTSHNISIEEKSIIFQSAITAIQLAPALSGILLKKHLMGIAMISKKAILRAPLTENLVTYCKKFDIFLFNGLSNEFLLKNWIRYCGIYIISMYIRLSRKFKADSKWMYVLLYRLAINNELSGKVVI